MSMVRRCVEAAAAWLGVLVSFFGGWSMGSRVLVVLMVADYVLGCACALTGHSQKTETGHFLSKVAFAGLLKKGAIMLVVLVAAMLDRALSGTLNDMNGAMVQTTTFRMAAEFFYIASESLSIIENAGLIGVPVPRKLKNALEALRDKDGAPEEEAKPEKAAPTDGAKWDSEEEEDG